MASTVYMYMHIHYLSFTDSPAASCSVVDGEEKKSTLTVAEKSCKMGGVKEDRKRSRRGMGMGRGIKVVRVDQRILAVGRRGRGRGRGKGDSLPIAYQQPCLPTCLGEYIIVSSLRLKLSLLL